jgi:hypothetical protein
VQLRLCKNDPDREKDLLHAVRSLGQYENGAAGCCVEVHQLATAAAARCLHCLWVRSSFTLACTTRPVKRQVLFRPPPSWKRWLAQTRRLTNRAQMPLRAEDFATDLATLSARLGFSILLPTEGVPEVSVAAPPATLPEAVPGPCSQPQRRPRRRKLDVTGRVFRMLFNDVRALWPQWKQSDRHRVSWCVLPCVGTDDRLQCRYTGTSDANRALIGNDGVTEFALSQRFDSGQSLLELLPSSPKYPYRQIGAKRFRCYSGRPPRGPGVKRSKFTPWSRCPHCRTQLFEGEISQLCCAGGKFVLPRGRPNPPELEQLLVNPDFPK